METKSTAEQLSDLAHQLSVRIQRAASHTQALANEIDAWTASDPIKLTPHIASDRLSWELRVSVKPPALVEWSTHFDDAVHNLRAVLDNLVWGIAVLDGVTPRQPTKIQFPIVKERTKWKDEVERIAELPEPVRLAIESIQPFQRTGLDGTPEQDALLLLNRLSNHEKHRLAIQPSLTPDELAHSFGVEFRTDEEAEMNCPPTIEASADMFVDDAVLIRWATKTPIVRVNGNASLKGRVVVEDEVVGLLGATTVLAQLVEYVPQVMNIVLGNVSAVRSDG